MKKIVVITLALIVVFVLTWFWYSANGRAKVHKFITDEVAEGDIVIAISASGSLGALTTVEVGSQISGNILKLYADFNDEVKAGQLLVKLDPSTYEAQLQQAIANLEGAKSSYKTVEAQMKNLRASLLNAQADITVSMANLRRAQVSRDDAQRNYHRQQELFDMKVASEAERDTALTNLELQKAAVDVARAQVESSKARVMSVQAQLESEEAQLQSAQARIRQMEAQLEIAQINLDRCNIYSPIDGVVISREVDEGQTVAASLQAPKLFVIAQDLKQMRIDTAIDEADIGGIVHGQPVKFTVDAYKNRRFDGVVDQVRLFPQETANVVTYSVMVNVKNNDLALKPGMTANVEIETVNRQNIIKLPIQALYFNAPEEMREQMLVARSRESADPVPGAVQPVQESGMQAGAGKGRGRGRGQNGGRAGQGEGAGGEKMRVPVWVMGDNGAPVVRMIRTGISDFDHAEVTSDNLKPGEKVVVGMEGQVTGGRAGVDARDIRRATRRM